MFHHLHHHHGVNTNAPNSQLSSVTITFQAVRSGTTIQLSKIEFYNENGSKLAISKVTNPGGNNPHGEECQNVANDNLNTKWLDRDLAKGGSTLVFTLAHEATVASYQFWTANDFPERDPTAWTIMGTSRFSGVPVLLEKRSGFAAPNARHAHYWSSPIPLEFGNNQGVPTASGSPPLKKIQITFQGVNSGDTIQLAKVVFFDDRGSQVPISNVANPGGNNPHGEEPHQVANDNLHTKWLDRHFGRNKRSTLIFTLSQPTRVRGYQFYTANDFPERDPTSWTLEGSSQENGNLSVLDTRTRIEPPPTRHTGYSNKSTGFNLL